MQKAPKIGTRVQYSAVLDYPGATARTAVGVVAKIWPKRIVLNEDELDNDPAWVMPRYGALKPESEWQVTVIVDTFPDWWPYGQHKSFCPNVADLEPSE